MDALTENCQSQLDLLTLGKLAPMILSNKIEFGELTVEIAASNISAFVEELLRNRMMEYTTLVDITAIDNPSNPQRFTVVYHFLSMTQNQRLRVHTHIADGETIASITPIHPSANWFEREVFDMFGIAFTGHPDLRRILTDYGFEGYPLRKDFPTSGYVQMRYDDVEKKCVYEPVELVQDYRQFDFLSPWENAKYILPGDEKKAD